MTTLSLRSFMRSSRAESIVAAVSWLALRGDDRRVATCPRLGGTGRLERARVRPETRSFPAGSANWLDVVNRVRSVQRQSLRPGVQMSTQDGS